MRVKEKDSKNRDEFAFLCETALKLGAADAKVIPATGVIVENRVPLKSRAGCIGYGKKLTCPPYVRTRTSSVRFSPSTALLCS